MTIARQLGLDPSTVSNFFMNARRRSIDKWREDPVDGDDDEDDQANEDPENDDDEDDEQEEEEDYEDEDSHKEILPSLRLTAGKAAAAAAVLAVNNGGGGVIHEMLDVHSISGPESLTGQTSLEL